MGPKPDKTRMYGMGETSRVPVTASNSSIFPYTAIESQIALYASNPLYGSTDSWLISNNPYRRPIRPQDVAQYAFTEPLAGDAIGSGSGLASHRMLLNIYESDMMMLPASGFGSVADDFRVFYSNENRLAGEMIRSTLERHVFGFLDTEIDVAGRWTMEDMTSFFDWRLEAVAKSDSAIAKAVLGAGAPVEATNSFLIQLAGDFLSEASAMARNVLGSFGPAQSELFKVLIDEYGYGVHATKHSTLYEATLKSCGLSPEVHAYWQFYLATSLALTNYFHYVSKNHELFFRYLGALYFTEASLVYVTRQQSKMLKASLDGRCDTTYFDEHSHIDQHHGRMVIDNIIVPVIEQCGVEIIPEIVRGFEEFRHLQDLADDDLIAQIEWSDQRAAYSARARTVVERIEAGDIISEPVTLTEPEGELSVTHVHDENELIVVEDGALDLVTGFDQSVTLGPGEGMLSPEHRLHGSVVVASSCTYHIFPLGKDAACLS